MNTDAELKVVIERLRIARDLIAGAGNSSTEVLGRTPDELLAGLEEVLSATVFPRRLRIESDTGRTWQIDVAEGKVTLMAEGSHPSDPKQVVASLVEMARSQRLHISFERVAATETTYDFSVSTLVDLARRHFVEPEAAQPRPATEGEDRAVPPVSDEPRSGADDATSFLFHLNPLLMAQGHPLSEDAAPNENQGDQALAGRIAADARELCDRTRFVGPSRARLILLRSRVSNGPTLAISEVRGGCSAAVLPTSSDHGHAMNLWAEVDAGTR